MQCRARDAYRRITGRGTPYPRKRWGFAVPTKNGTPQGAALDTGGASSPCLKAGASALALGDGYGCGTVAEVYLIFLLTGQGLLSTLAQLTPGVERSEATL